MMVMGVGGDDSAIIVVLKTNSKEFRVSSIMCSTTAG